MGTLFNYLETLFTNNVLGGAKVRGLVRVCNEGRVLLGGGGGGASESAGGKFDVLSHN